MSTNIDVLRLPGGIISMTIPVRVNLTTSEAATLAAGIVQALAGPAPATVVDQSKPLQVSAFLADKIIGDPRGIIAASFGRHMLRAYVTAHGHEPATVGRGTNTSRLYTEADRPLMEQVWADHFADEEVAR